MIGTSTPFMMRSMPRRNGSIWPMRVIWPSGKMQTTSPSFSASVAVRREWIISRGPWCDEIGITPMIFANGLTSGCSYKSLNIRKRIGRSMEAISSTASTIET